MNLHQTGFKYDVFLSFADEDRIFATNYLHTPLRKAGYDVFWHYSDFIAGLTIDENMIRATKLCRRVIFVCSKHFDKSEFCQKELKYALHSHYSDYHGEYRRIIPLVIRGGECSKELKQLHPIEIKSPGTSKGEVKKLIKRLYLGKAVIVNGFGKQKMCNTACTYIKICSTSHRYYIAYKVNHTTSSSLHKLHNH